ncbi:MAG: hypothetical protein KatS3mg126_2136 [Lysobacteraceae bacterium]|nr:MAG: hypothetical protein KatS3mg126_2136 [Xanthomonadaceae bacterium]
MHGSSRFGAAASRRDSAAGWGLTGLRARFWLALAGLGLAWALAAPAPVGAADAAGFEAVRFRHIGVQEGLSQPTVRAITQDRTGFLWLGTQEGLNRFDGYGFRAFLRRAGDAASLPENHVTALAPAPEGGVWVGTLNGGLVWFDADRGARRVWKPGARDEAALASPVRALLAPRWGGLWVASGADRVQFLASTGGDLEPPVPLPEGGFGLVRSLREAGDGAVLVVASRGLFRIADAGAPPVRIEGGWRGSPVDVQEADDGRLWVAVEDDGIWRLDGEGGSERVLGMEEGLPDLAFSTLLFDRAGRLWIGTRTGLARWTVDAQQLEVWRGDAPNTEDGLASGRVQSLFEDRDGLIWVGTWLNGVNLHDPRTEAFRIARPVPGHARALPGWAANDVLPGAPGRVWVALSDVNEVVELDLAAGVQRRLSVAEAVPPPPAGARPRSLAAGAGGGWHVALGPGGIGSWSGQGPIRRGGDRLGLEPPAGPVFELHRDRAGGLWVGTVEDGLAFLCAGCNRFQHWRERQEDPASLPGDEVTAILATGDGSLWIGTRHRGAARLLPDRSGFERLPPVESGLGLAHPYVTAFLEDGQGVLWIGTQGGGLHRVARDARGAVQAVRVLDRSRGLGADAIGAIQEDREGRIWVSTTVGLSRLDRSRRRIDNFGQADGALPGGYFIGSAAVLADGRMLFGGPRGLSLFDPLDVQPPPDPHAVAISDLAAGEGLQGSGPGTRPAWVLREEDGRRRIELSPGIDDVGIELTALSFASPEQVRFEYRLRPLEDWRSADARRRFIRYHDLPPGSYTFEARARRPNGPPGETLSLGIEVPKVLEPAEFLARAALLVAGGLVLLLMYFVFQRRRERRMARRRLAESEARLKLALWGTGDELWDYDLRHNRLHREHPLPMLAVPTQDLIEDAAALTEHVHAEDAPALRAALGRLLQGEEDVLDASFRVRGREGAWVWVRARARVASRDGEGRALRVVGTLGDVTALKESEAALQAANRELEQRVEARTAQLSRANQELATALEELRRAQRQLVEQEKMAALGALVAGVAHEINTPIGIAVTAASHLEQSARDLARAVEGGTLTRSALNAMLESSREGADLILCNLRRADQLIRTFKQVAVDQGSQERRVIDLAAYVDEVLTTWQPQLRRQQHRVVCEIEPGIVFETLPGAIYQVLSNLIQNALVHAFEGRDGGGTITLHGRRLGDALELIVADDGVGMSEEVRARVFEPFFTTRRGQGGSGLGLHIVYNLVTQALKGSISCQSAPGQGSRFVIVLPLVAGPGGGDQTGSG